jgi:hypothetical protein
MAGELPALSRHPVSTGTGPPLITRRPARRYPTTHLPNLAYVTRSRPGYARQGYAPYSSLANHTVPDESFPPQELAEATTSILAPTGVSVGTVRW